VQDCVHGWANGWSLKSPLEEGKDSGFYSLALAKENKLSHQVRALSSQGTGLITIFNVFPPSVLSGLCWVQNIDTLLCALFAPECHDRMRSAAVLLATRETRVQDRIGERAKLSLFIDDVAVCDYAKKDKKDPKESARELRQLLHESVWQYEKKVSTQKSQLETKIKRWNGGE
jgi:hypothetical protein